MPFDTRLTLATASGLCLPDTPPLPVVVFGTTPDRAVSGIGDPLIVSRDARVHDAWPGAVETPPSDASAAVVLISRAKARARAELATAASLTGGPLIVDGQKTDGIEPMLKAMRARGTVSGMVSKAHGKLFWCDHAPNLSDWAAKPLTVDGLASWPGVFSAEKVDPGSALLAQALPTELGRAVCDLGAGWGWLSAQIAERVTDLHMVETDGWALDCARANVPNATAHWADVTRWQSPRLFDSVVMNPPFHEGRKGVPDLGQAFIAKAAEILAPSGQLFMVANRHLPYEHALQQAFAEVSALGGNGRYKVLRAGKPRSRSRGASKSRTLTRTRR